MQRNLERLANGRYDLVVIGGGIHGACIAWDAALRGLSVALLEKGDFGHATSANTLKIIHGGLRYLQDADLGLVRLMARERTIWMRIAPHLVHPLPCVMPTSNKLARSKVVMTAALMINDLISYDRNSILDPQKHLPNGRPISRSECLQLLPGLNPDGVTGGAVWHDAQMHNSERLLLSFVLSGTQAGAEVANYVEVTGFLRHGMDARGVTAKDLFTGDELEIQADLVINSAGPWVDSVLGLLKGDFAPRFHVTTALDLVSRQILPEYGVGIPSRYTTRDREGNLTQHSRMLFAVPWRGHSLIGTIHTPYTGTMEDYRTTDENIDDFVDEINVAYPGAALTRQDVSHVHWGFLPGASSDFATNVVKLVRQSRIYDHERENCVRGLITVLGVKYTTARHAAEEVVNLACAKLDHQASPCRTHETPIYGGEIDGFDDFLDQAIQERPPGLDPNVVEHLVYSYGSEYPQILRYLDQQATWGQTLSPVSPVLEAEVVHAVREEMALKLTDVVQRRTELGAAGLPDEASLRTCTQLMAAELGWDQARQDAELAELRAAYTTTICQSD